MIAAVGVPEALVTKRPSPGRARLEARSIVAQGLDKVQGFELRPLAATYQVFAETPAEAVSNKPTKARAMMSALETRNFSQRSGIATEPFSLDFVNWRTDIELGIIAMAYFRLIKTRRFWHGSRVNSRSKLRFWPAAGCRRCAARCLRGSPAFDPPKSSRKPPWPPADQSRGRLHPWQTEFFLPPRPRRTSPGGDRARWRRTYRQRDSDALSAA